MKKKLGESLVDREDGSTSILKVSRVNNSQGEVGEAVGKAALFVLAPRANVMRVDRSIPLNLEQETEARDKQMRNFMKDYPDLKDSSTMSANVQTFEEVRTVLGSFFSHKSGIGSRARKSMVIYLGHGDGDGNLLLNLEKEPVQTRDFIQEIDTALRDHYQQGQSEETPEITVVLLTHCNSHKVSKYPGIHTQITITPLSSLSEPATNYDIESIEVTRKDGQIQEEIVDSIHIEMSDFARRQLSSSDNADDSSVTSGDLKCMEGTKPKAHPRWLQLAQENGEKEHGIRQLAERGEYMSHRTSPSGLAAGTGFDNPVDGSHSSAGNSLSSSSLVSDEHNARQDHNAGGTQPQNMPDWDSGFASQWLEGNEPKGLDYQKTFLFDGGDTEKKFTEFASRDEQTRSAEADPRSHIGFLRSPTPLLGRTQLGTMKKKLGESLVDREDGSTSIITVSRVKNSQGEVGEAVGKAALFVLAPLANVMRVDRSIPLNLEQETEARDKQMRNFMKDYPDLKDSSTMSANVHTFAEVRTVIGGFFSHTSGIGSRARKSMVIYLGHGDGDGNLLLHLEEEPVPTRDFIQEIDTALRDHYQQGQSEETPEITVVLLTQCNSHKVSKYSGIHTKITITPLSSLSEPATNYDIESIEVTRKDGQVQEEIVDSIHIEMSDFARSQLSSSDYADDSSVTSGDLKCMDGTKPKAHPRWLQVAQENGEKEHGIRQLESSKQFSAIKDNKASSWASRLVSLGRSTNPNDSSFDLSRWDMSFTSSSSLQMFDSFDIERGEYTSPSGLAAGTGPANPIDRSNSSAGNNISSSSLMFDEHTARKDHKAGVTQPQDVPEWDSGYASPCYKEKKPKGLDDQHRADKKTFMFEERETKKLAVFASRDEPASSAEAKPGSHTANTQRVTKPIPQRPGSNVTDNVEYSPREEATNANLTTPESTGAAATRVTHSSIGLAGEKIEGNTPVTSTDSGVGSSGKLYMFPAHKLNL